MMNSGRAIMKDHRISRKCTPPFFLSFFQRGTILATSPLLPQIIKSFQNEINTYLTEFSLRGANSFLKS